MLSSESSPLLPIAVGPADADGSASLDSSNFFRDVLQHMPVAAAVCDHAGVVVASNELWRTLSEGIFSKPLERGASLFGSGTASHPLTKPLSQILAGGESRLESVVSVGNSQTLFKLSAYPVNGEKGAQVVAITLPASGEAQPNSLAQAVIASASDFLFVVDKRLRVRFVNRALGNVDIRDVLGRPITSFLEPVTRPVAEEKIGEVLRNGVRAQFKNVFLDHEHRRRAFEARVAPIIRGKTIVGAVINVSDVTGWHQSQARLNNEKVRYQQLFNSMPVMLHGADAEGRITTVNDHWLEKLGYTREEVVGQMSRKFFTPQSQLVLRSGYDRKVFDASGDVALQMIHKDGSTVDVLSGVTMERDARGEVLGIQARMIDITARNRAEAALRKSEARFQRAVRGTSDGLWDWDLESGLVWYAPRFKELLGYRPDEFADNFVSLKECLHPDDRGGTLAAMSQHLDGKRPFDIECRLRTKESGYQWFRIRGLAHRGDDGATRRMAGSIQDITLQKHAERALRTNRNFYELILDSVPAYIVYVDARLRLQFLNRACTALFGINKHAALGQRFDELVPGEPYQALEPLIDKVFAGQSARADMAWDQDTSRSLNLDVELIPHNSQEQESRVLGFFLIARDMTRHIQLENELRQAQKMDAVGQLTGGIAHDFNNLLSVIIGNLQLLERKLRHDDALGNKVQTARRAATRGADLTRRLLAFARQQVLAPEVVDINALVRGMEDLLRRSLGEAVSIEFSEQAGVWPIEVDPSQVENSLLNLTINARDAMGAGGHLLISTENREVSPAEDGTQPVPPGSYVVLSVHDNGSGIPKDLIDQVVEPFFTTKEVGKGTGLGLSMVFGFVEQSGGHGRIESEPGQGTTVSLYFPRTQSSIAELVAGEELEDDALPRGDETILVVEDDADLRATAVTILEELGYTIVEADSPKSAIALIESRGQDIDLLFTDVMMPGGMRGTQLASQARALRPELKVLYTTGFTATGILSQEMLTDGADLLGKPYRAEDLAACLRQLLDEPEAPA